MRSSGVAPAWRTIALLASGTCVVLGALLAFEMGRRSVPPPVQPDAGAERPPVHDARRALVATFPDAGRAPRPDASGAPGADAGLEAAAPDAASPDAGATPTRATLVLGDAGYGVRVSVPATLAVNQMVSMTFDVTDPDGAPLAEPSIRVSLERDGVERSIEAKAIDPGRYELTTSIKKAGHYHVHVHPSPRDKRVHIYFDLHVGERPIPSLDPDHATHE